MAIVTLAEVKTLLQISDTSSDTLITTLIPLVEGTIRNYTHQNWQDSPAIPSWQAWMKIPASSMIGYQLNQGVASLTGFKAESQGGYSYTRGDMVEGYPADILKAFDQVRVVSTVYGQKMSQYQDRRGLSATQLVNNDMIPGGWDGVPIE